MIDDIDGLRSSKIVIITAQDKDLNKRLDRFMVEALPERTRSQIQKWIEKQRILVNGKLVKAGHKIRSQEEITVHLPDLPLVKVFPESIPLDIVYEDEDLAVINKPAGMVVHRGAGATHGTLVNALLHHFRELSQFGGCDRPGIVHRLDKQTSGLLVVAKNDISHVNLAYQFQSRVVTKKYIALVHGDVDLDSGEIRSPIGRHRVHRAKMTTRGSHAREAYTHYDVLEKFKRFTLLQLSIKTGRTHQIRVHLSSIKHPVVGDTLYGARERILLPGMLGSQLTLERYFLHAAWLEFKHPRSHTPLCFSRGLPEELELFLKRIREHFAII